jgi:hypothetical protein
MRVVEETYNKFDSKGRPETTTVNSVSVVHNLVSFQFILSNLKSFYWTAVQHRSGAEQP